MHSRDDVKIAFVNTWLLSLPLILVFSCISVFHRDTAKRLGDMSGYTTGEKAWTMLASLAPYPFMILTVFTPFTSNAVAIAIGSLLYAVGLAGFLLSVISYTKVSGHELAMRGPYRLSRNPMYVAALLIFASIVLLALNGILLAMLIIIVPLQHGMIRAEERACAGRFGKNYELYRGKTPRYLFL